MTIFMFRDVWWIGAFINPLGLSFIVIIHYQFITTSDDSIPPFMCAMQDEKIRTCAHTCFQVELNQKVWYSAERYSPEIQICTHSEKNQFALNKMSYQNRRPDNSPSYPTQEEEVALPQHLSFRNGQAEMSVRQRNGRQHDRTRFRSRSRSPQSQRASRSRTRSSRIDIPSWNMYDASYQVQQHYSNGPQSATYGPTSPTYDDPGSPSYDDPTSPSCDGPTSPTYADPGSPSYDDPTSSSCDDPTSPTYADPGSPSYDDPTPQYDAPMSPRYEDSVRIDPDVLIEKDGNKKFRINRLIGEGGYGKVFEVREEGTTDLFAIKILKPQQYKTDLFAVELRRGEEGGETDPLDGGPLELFFWTGRWEILLETDEGAFLLGVMNLIFLWILLPYILMSTWIDRR
ncbi:unnamed protein product [Caenorhabditis nigoni]